MNVRLPPKEMCSGSRDLFYLVGIGDNISEMMQGRDMIEMEVK